MKNNFLDRIPKVKEGLKWEKGEDEAVTIFVENKGFFNRLFQLILKKPKVTQIHLEEFGSFIWICINGNDSIYDIGRLVGERFGDKAEPLYPRLAEYMKMLADYGFITF